MEDGQVVCFFVETLAYKNDPTRHNTTRAYDVRDLRQSPYLYMVRKYILRSAM